MKEILLRIADIHWNNLLWLLLPIFLWNIWLGSHLSHPLFQSDHLVPKPLQVGEHFFRILIFVLPLWFVIPHQEPHSTWGWGLFGLGLLLYFLSWVPLVWFPQTAWSHSLVGLLAPAYTPLLWLLGIALLAGNGWYAGFSLAFTAFHVGNYLLIWSRLLHG